MIWSDFKQIVNDLITVDSDRQGITAGINRKIKLGVVDLQSYVPFYRQHHETVYQEDDVTDEGEASTGMLPTGARIQDAYYITANMPCRQRPLVSYPWSNRNDLICGNVALINNAYFITVDPYGQQFYVFPKVSAGMEISLFWNGTKNDFDDTDETPFDDAVGEAVAEYVKAWVSKEVDKDLALSKSYKEDYAESRSALYLDTREQTRLGEASREQSPQPEASCSKCIPVDATVEFVAFGDSGEDSFDDFGNISVSGQLTNTANVATLVKSLRPDFIIHLGDSNYPVGDPVKLQDHLTTFYYGWIPDDFYMTFGNHDQDTDGGAALLALLPHVAEANGGKLYYKFTRGSCDFFVLNAGATGTFDPDGSSAGSIMGLWLESAMAASSAQWKIVCIHKAPYSSDSSYTPGQVEFRWPALDNADLVLSGHAHNHERLVINGVTYLVCGLGGATKRTFGATAPGSQFRYTDKYGCVRVSATSTRLQASFVTTDKEVVDLVTLKK